MIVSYQQEGWKVITQRAHGMLAFQLAVHWENKHSPAYWLELLLAIAEHDDAEVELDGENLLTPQGGPLNFDMKTFDLAHCTRVSEFSQTKSRFVALLTSMHMDFLYGKDAENNKIAARFLQDQKKYQTKLRKELSVTKAVADKAYALLEWSDALSLLLCQDKVQPEQRAIEISKGPDKKQYFLSKNSHDELIVSPWPFAIDLFDVSVEYRLINQLSFTDSAAFRASFYKAPIFTQTWKMKRQ